jgi:hypothetical protein
LQWICQLLHEQREQPTERANISAKVVLLDLTYPSSHGGYHQQEQCHQPVLGEQVVALGGLLLLLPLHQQQEVPQAADQKHKEQQHQAEQLLQKSRPVHHGYQLHLMLLLLLAELLPWPERSPACFSASALSQSSAAVNGHRLHVQLY